MRIGSFNQASSPLNATMASIRRATSRRCATASGSRRGPYSQQMLKEFGWITEARGRGVETARRPSNAAGAEV